MIKLNTKHKIFIDKSVDMGDIDDTLSDETIHVKIRDEYLLDSTVTILLVGTETKFRKHVDWELYSSMRDGMKNKKSGILVLMLPTVQCNSYTVGHGEDEKKLLYPDMPERIIDCLLNGESHISEVQ